MVILFRLDFVSFTIGQPSTTTLGTCTDTFMVGGSKSSVPVICGDNAGQHSKLKKKSSMCILYEIREF
jgi:hypothetical protein